MDEDGMAYVQGSHHAAVWNILHVLQLHFAHAGGGSPVGTFVIERSYLHEIERKLTSVPFAAQVFDEGRHQVFV